MTARKVAKKLEQQHVYFRQTEEIGPLALLPDLPFDGGDVYRMMYYQDGRKIEEAGGSVEDILERSTRATPDQYAKLKEFLENKGYKLTIIG